MKTGDLVFDEQDCVFGVLVKVHSTLEHVVLDDLHPDGEEVTEIRRLDTGNHWLAPTRVLHEARMTFVGPVLWPECKFPEMPLGSMIHIIRRQPIAPITQIELHFTLEY